MSERSKRVVATIIHFVFTVAGLLLLSELFERAFDAPQLGVRVAVLTGIVMSIVFYLWGYDRK